MIIEPIYDTVDDARTHKVSKSIKARVKTGRSQPKTQSSSTKLTKQVKAEAKAEAVRTLERLVGQLEATIRSQPIGK